MQNDLLDADAAVRWAMTQLPSMHDRFELWLKENVEAAPVELESCHSHYAIKHIEKQPLPLSFSVEVGAYINTIRSALDILATTIAKRHGIVGKALNEIYFPVAKCKANFDSRKFKGAELVKRMSAPERKIIENLEPYQGGNKTLWAFHDLDITRKHRNLLAVKAAPDMITVSAPSGDYSRQAPPGWVPENNEPILGFLRKGGTQCNITYIPRIIVAKIELPGSREVMSVIDSFGTLAWEIISSFDVA